MSQCVSTGSVMQGARLERIKCVEQLDEVQAQLGYNLLNNCFITRLILSG